MGEVLNININETKAFRMSKRHDRTRPIIICFSNGAAKNKFMQAYKQKKLTAIDPSYINAKTDEYLHICGP